MVKSVRKCVLHVSVPHPEVQHRTCTSSVPVCLCLCRLVGGRTATCGCATTPGLATAPSWNLWMTRSTSEWSLWRRGPSSSWSRLTRALARAFGTQYHAACPWTQGRTPYCCPQPLNSLSTYIRDCTDLPWVNSPLKTHLSILLLMFNYWFDVTYQLQLILTSLLILLHILDLSVDMSLSISTANLILMCFSPLTFSLFL